MDLPLNQNIPSVMHIDLNSCFATAEQQANPLLRGKPVVVAAYTTDSGCILSPSIEAKKYGIKTGMRVRDAKVLCNSMIVLASDPPKYRDIHLKFCRIFKDYSSSVTPKSIDEAIIDFSSTPSLLSQLTNIAKEIKLRMKKEIGEWISCSIGISTNRFLAKLGSSLHKPDGLRVINYKNLEEVYSNVTLVDLYGINISYQARLNYRGILNPLDFLRASRDKLVHQVFKSIVGHYWYLRLRGWEIDNVDFERKSFGQQYALSKWTSDVRQLCQILMKLTEKMGRRLRHAGFSAKSIHVAVSYSDYSHWHHGQTFMQEMFTTSELFKRVFSVFNMQPKRKVVSKLEVSCFHFVPKQFVPLTLFETDKDRKWRATEAADSINDRFGEFVITPALMMETRSYVPDRIAFGNVKELEDLYASG